MAQIHSPRPTGNSTEARIYDLLADSLNDDWQVWHEPEIHRAEDEDKPYRPDFVLLHRNHGLFVLEVKGWMLEQIKGVRTNKKIMHTELFYKFRDGKQWIEASFDQLNKYKSKIRQKLNYHKLSLGLSSKKINKLLDGAVAFANISREELYRPIHEDSTNLLSIKRAKVLTGNGQQGFYKSEIDTWKARPEQVECGLTKSSGELVLSEPELDVIRGIIHPESCLPVAPGNLITVEQLRAAEKAPVDGRDSTKEEQSDKLRVLSQKQESVARYEIGSGHKVLFGVAGSGKTMILIARARWQAMLNPARKILVLCYNRALSLYICRVLEEYNNIDVMTFHAWARERLDFNLHFNDAKYSVKLLDHLRKHGADQYDSILIDECQDWEPDWFKAVLFAAKDPKQGDLLIVGDGSQSIRKKQRYFSWQNCGINPQPWRGIGDSTSLTFDRNYRNTQQIAALASSFIRGDETQEDCSGEDILSLIPNPNECVGGEGSKPKLGRFSDRTREMQFVATSIHDLIDRNDNLEYCDLAVVYPGYIGAQEAETQFGALFENLENMSIPYVHVRGGEMRNQHMLLEGNSVKILNVQQMKGLEQRVCFVVGIDEYHAGDGNLLYVAMTRATDQLFLSWSTGDFMPIVARPNTDSSPGMDKLKELEELLRARIINRLTADSSLYDWCGSPLGKTKTNPVSRATIDRTEINEILDCLNSERVRCTYNSLAEYLNVGMKDVIEKLGQRRPEASWVVNKKSRKPTGYIQDQIHPDLCTSKEVITTGAALERLLKKFRGERG